MKRVFPAILFIYLMIPYHSIEGQDKTIQPPDYEWEQKLTLHLTELSVYNRSGDSLSEGRVLKNMAGEYESAGVYRRAAQLYAQEFSMYNREVLPAKAAAAQNCGRAYESAQSDSLATEWYIKAAELFRQADMDDDYNKTIEYLGNTYARMADYSDALTTYNSILEYYINEPSKNLLPVIYYRIGSVQFRNNNPTEALRYYTLALQNTSSADPDYSFLADLWANTAICHQNLGNEAEMMRSFQTALEYSEKAGRKDEEARLERILSGIYFIKKDIYHAELYCLDAINDAVEVQRPDILQDCYLHYSDILKSGNDFIKALEFYEKHLALRDSLSFAARLIENENKEIISQYETLEQSIREKLAGEEIRDLELERLKADSARRANEILLLTRERELEKSETDRQAQAFELERERFELSRREQEVVSLLRQQEIDSLRVKQKEDEANALEAANQLLEKDKLQKETELKNEKLARQLTTAAGVLFILIAAFILFGLISTRRKNQKLAESKKHIEKINADLEATNSEVIKQKEIIEQKNQSITDSIQYASRIQTAVLPPSDFLTEWDIENFILFKPKDIVSGDFYWGKEKDGKIIAAAADCTGHGVPGAFMSMLGNAFLEEIVNAGNYNDAAGILNLLRDEIINTLKQKGSTGETRDGMDISLSIIDRKSGRLDFAGANNPLYLFRDGELMKIPADKMPIGIHFVSALPFKNHLINIEKGDTLYMFSDGYADQFGGPRGRKLMYKPFQEILHRIHHLPMPDQKEILDQEFEKWKGDFEQVDDVLVIGIRL